MSPNPSGPSPGSVARPVVGPIPSPGTLRPVSAATPRGPAAQGPGAGPHGHPGHPAPTSAQRAGRERSEGQSRGRQGSVEPFPGQAPTSDPHQERNRSQSRGRSKEKQPAPAKAGPPQPANASPANRGMASSAFDFLRAAGSAMKGRRLEDVCNIDKGRKPLGTGSFGTVWRATMKSDGAVVAVKTLDKRKMKDMHVPESLVLNEVALMQECSGQVGFVMMYDFINTSSAYYLVMEFCDGGTLEDATTDGAQQLGERQVVRLMEQVFQGIAYLHGRSICHRDIKPQNAMMLGRASSETVSVKLGDFGIAARMQPNRLLTDKVGTPAFMAPEMHLLPDRSRGYDLKVDMWAAGAVMVFLLAHEYPFVDNSGRLMRDQLLRGDLPIWDTHSFSALFQAVQEVAGLKKKRPSKLAQDLVRRLLDPKRQHRLSASAALQHSWLRTPVPRTDVEAPLQQGDEMPLLMWDDFQEGFSGIERDFHQMATSLVDAMGDLQISAGYELPMRLDPNDERLQSCVVCFNSPGDLGYICPQCRYTVCMPCLWKLPKAECPHCRHAATDVVVTQAVTRFAQDAASVFKVGAQGMEQVAQVGLGQVDFDIDLGCSEQARARQVACHFCKAASGVTNHVCPCCRTSICMTCAQDELAQKPLCPCCRSAAGERALREYLAATNAAAEVVGYFSRGASDFMGAISTRVSAFSTSADYAHQELSRAFSAASLDEAPPTPWPQPWETGQHPQSQLVEQVGGRAPPHKQPVQMQYLRQLAGDPESQRMQSRQRSKELPELERRQEEEDLQFLRRQQLLRQQQVQHQEADKLAHEQELVREQQLVHEQQQLRRQPSRDQYVHQQQKPLQQQQQQQQQKQPYQDHEDEFSARSRSNSQAQLPMHHQCALCNVESSGWDLTCPSCRVSVCSSCIHQRLATDPHCPNCKSPEFCSAQTVELMRNAMQVRESANLLWEGLVGVGRGLFGDTAEPTRSPLQPPPSSFARVHESLSPISQRGSAGPPLDADLVMVSHATVVSM